MWLILNFTTESEEDKSNDEDNGNESSESDGEAEKCPVCLSKFRQQVIGTPESCDHTFCLECIEEWSKVINTVLIYIQLITIRAHYFKQNLIVYIYTNGTVNI